MPHIYILHFDVPLSHAEHYCGVTTNLKQRLNNHATGGGSTLCRELAKRGIPWRLSTLAECTHAEMRRIERRLKDTNNVPRYCAICSQPPAAIPETRDYPIDMIPFPTESKLLSHAKTIDDVRIYNADRRVNKPLLTVTINELWRRDKDALGFIPLNAIAQAVSDGRVTVIEHNAEIIGYVLHTLNQTGTRLTIAQIAIREDRRLLQLGRDAVNCLHASHPRTHIVAKVRANLAATEFWRAIGFTKRRTVIHTTSKQPIDHFYRHPFFGATISWNTK